VGVLTKAGAEVADTSPGGLLVSGLPAERIVVLLPGNGLPFSEVAAHRASLKQAYLDLTRAAVEYRGAPSAGGAMTTTKAPGRATPTDNAGFGCVLRAEWVKFRTVRGWVTGMIAAVILMDLVGLFVLGGSRTGCGNGGSAPAGARARAACLQSLQPPPTGPGGEAVSDQFYFVRQLLTGDGSITVRMTSLTGLVSGGTPAGRISRGQQPGMQAGHQPWSKAGSSSRPAPRRDRRMQR
jgi:hypothetical protein